MQVRYLEAPDRNLQDLIGNIETTMSALNFIRAHMKNDGEKITAVYRSENMQAVVVCE